MGNLEEGNAITKPLGQNGKSKHLPPNERSDEKEMSFLDHLEELRWHIIRSLVAIVSIGIVLYIFEDWVFGTLFFGPTKPDFISYKMICDLSHSLGLGATMCFEPPEFSKIAIGFAETFITSIKVCFITGFVFSFPFVFWEIWRFVSPGLYANERRATRGIVFVCSFLFLLGVMFGYFVIAPFAINFLGGYALPGVENSPTLSSFIIYMVMFTIPAGLIFELPIVVYFLSKIGLITHRDMKKYRRHAIISILVLAAFLTPPDVVTQFLIGIPLFILYEVSILIAARVVKAEERREKGEEKPTLGSLIKKWRSNNLNFRKKKKEKKKPSSDHPNDPEDLKVIIGIGPKVEELLKDAGIDNWSDLANTTVEELREILQAGGENYRLANPESWPKQAELAAQGKWQELKAFRNSL